MCVRVCVCVCAFESVPICLKQMLYMLSIAAKLTYQVVFLAS